MISVVSSRVRVRVFVSPFSKATSTFFFSRVVPFLTAWRLALMA